MQGGDMRITFLATLLVAELTIGLSFAQAPEKPTKDICEPEGEFTVDLKVIGPPLTGLSVEINGRSAKIVGYDRNCHTIRYPFGNNFRWDLIRRPVGSAASLANTNTLAVRLPLDKAGTYTVRFTGCPSGCVIGGITVAPATFDINIVARTEVAVPPETVPVTPPSANQPRNNLWDDADGKCNGGGGFIAPEWVTVNPWNGSQDYTLLEGWVVSNRVSREDNPLTHNLSGFGHTVNDLDFFVIPDTSFDNLLFLGSPFGRRELVEVEWERRQIGEEHWPTAGDRVSVFGYGFPGCGHAPFDVEIHPPLGIAVHRARAISIPADRQLPFPPTKCPEPPCLPFLASIGTDVYVPGIVTDVFFNPNGGAMMDCSAPSLHQPAIEDACIPDPSPLNRIFEFNIYLPRDPRSIYQAAGKVVPPVPLYFQALPGAGPNPSIRVVREGDVSYLHVAIDMTVFPGQIYSRRIVAAWAYPSPDNWGLRSWRVRLNSIDVHDRRSGDWRMWLTTPNTDREWTRIIECDNCITEGTLTSLHVSGGSLPLPIETGGLLGPDLLLFRGQNVIVQASGYAAGFEGLGDDLGVINDSWPQQSADYSRLSDAGKYTLNYSVFPGPAPRRPSLSTSASDLYSAYRLTPGNIPPFPPPVASPVITSLRERVLAPSAQSTPADALQFRKREEGPGKTLDSITVADFRQSLTRAVSRGRATKVERTLLKLQQYFEEGLRSGLRAHFLAGLPNRLRWLKQSLPRDWYDKYFVAIG